MKESSPWDEVYQHKKLALFFSSPGAGEEKEERKEKCCKNDGDYNQDDDDRDVKVMKVVQKQKAQLQS